MGTTWSRQPSPAEKALQLRLEAAWRDAQTTNRINCACFHLDAIPRQLLSPSLHETLKYIVLDNNDISELPPDIGLFSNLEVLKVLNNRLVTIPPEIGNLKKLRICNAGKNRLQSVPSTIGRCVSLVELILLGNRLTDLPNEMEGLTELTHLDVAYNLLSEIPPNVRALTSLTKIDMSGNTIDSSKPGTWQLVSAQTFNLSCNSLSSVPCALGRLTHLVTLDIRCNGLKLLPAEIGFLTNLVKLDARDNELLEIPLEIGNLTHLKELLLSNNCLESVPALCGGQTSLVILDLKRNRLKKLCPEIGRMVELQSLLLDHNLLGDLPPSFENLTNVTDLSIGFNDLTNIDMVVHMHKLESLYASKNKIEALPDGITQLASLRDLQLGDNLLSSFPKEASAMLSLASLNLFQNRFTSFPIPVTEIPYLQSLSISYNEVGTLPPEIGRMSNLREFHTARASLSVIPPEIGQLEKLSTLYCGFNLLRSLPLEMGKLRELRILDIKGNFLEALPEELSGVLVRDSRVILSSFSIATNITEDDVQTDAQPPQRPSIVGTIQPARPVRRSEEEVKTVGRGSFAVPLRLPVASTESTKSEGANPASRVDHHAWNFPNSSPMSLRRVKSVPTLESTVELYGIQVLPNFPASPLRPSSQSTEGSALPRLSLSSSEGVDIGESLMTGRRPFMEDYVMINRMFNGNPKHHYIALFDGHCGQDAALFAARNLHRVVRKLCSEGGEESLSIESAPSVLSKAFRWLKQSLYDKQPTMESGTTCVSLIIMDGRMIVCNLGDSRAVLCRQGKAIRLNVEHKPRTEMKRIRDLGGYVTADNRLNGILGVSRCLGDFYLLPYVSCQPDVTSWDLTQEDEFVIVASDGLWEVLSDSEAVNIARQEGDVWQAADRLRDTAYLLGSTDNISVIVAHFRT